MGIKLSGDRVTTGADLGRVRVFDARLDRERPRMSSLPRVAEAIQSVLTGVPEAVARSTGYCVRRSKLSADAFVQTTVLGWWQHPEATLTQLSQTAALRGTPISPQGLDHRFTLASAALLRERVETAVAQVITAEPVATALLQRFSAVYLLDSTTVTLPDALAAIWPGCGGRVATGAQAALKLTVRLDALTGRLDGPDLHAGRTQDRAAALQHAPVPPGALRIADQGFWSLGVLERIAGAGGFFLGRYHRQTQVALDGVWLDLPRWLAAQTAPELDLGVTLGKAARLSVRLLAIRVPQDVADERRRRQRAEAKREGTALPPPTLADWTLLVTNAPPALLSLPEARVLARLRWQIELLFKLWKSHGKLATSRSAKPERILCEVYAKLLAVVLQHWVLLVACWAIADRSLVRVVKPIRDLALLILLTLADPGTLAPVLGRVLPRGVTAARTDKRRRRPSACQLLADPDLIALA
jgi:hypothetical protein